MTPDENQAHPREGLLNRFRRTFSRQAPQDPTIVQVMAQWAEYELIFNDILLRLNAQLARQAKVQKKALARIAQDEAAETPEAAPSAPHQTTKQALRSQVARQQFGPRIDAILAAKEATRERANQDS